MLVEFDIEALPFMIIDIPDQERGASPGSETAHSQKLDIMICLETHGIAFSSNRQKASCDTLNDLHNILTRSCLGHFLSLMCADKL